MCGTCPGGGRQQKHHSHEWKLTYEITHCEFFTFLYHRDVSFSTCGTHHRARENCSSGAAPRRSSGMRTSGVEPSTLHFNKPSQSEICKLRPAGRIPTTICVFTAGRELREVFPFVKGWETNKQNQKKNPILRHMETL